LDAGRPGSDREEPAVRRDGRSRASSGPKSDSPAERFEAQRVELREPRFYETGLVPEDPEDALRDLCSVGRTDRGTVVAADSYGHQKRSEERSEHPDAFTPGVTEAFRLR
jgi:hypothetical protein